MVCSLKHEETISPFRSRIKVIKWEDKGHSIPINCRQCEEAPCAEICPTKAIFFDESIGGQVIDYKKCIGCRSCVLVCPFGAMSFNSENKKIAKCDLCEGDPLCVKFCAYGTLTYVEADQINEHKLSSAAELILKTCKFNP